MIVFVYPSVSLIYFPISVIDKMEARHIFVQFFLETIQKDLSRVSTINLNINS
jgi:hypothetical protein